MILPFCSTNRRPVCSIHSLHNQHTHSKIFLKDLVNFHNHTDNHLGLGFINKFYPKYKEECYILLFWHFSIDLKLGQRANVKFCVKLRKPFLKCFATSVGWIHCSEWHWWVQKDRTMLKERQHCNSLALWKYQNNWITCSCILLKSINFNKISFGADSTDFSQMIWI